MSAQAQFKAHFPEVNWSQLTPPRLHPFYNYNGFHPDRSRVLRPGHRKEVGRRVFSVSTVLDSDVPIRLRDGTILRADVFRPDEDHTVPAILLSSPYGKTGAGGQSYDMLAPYAGGVPASRTSGYEKFEGPDPAEWVERGYAVVNIDSRGSGNSDGDMVLLGPADAEDVHDAIDWTAAQPWCSGSVVMAGTSWLAMSQVNYASRLKHPALKAIAPWEGATNVYHDFAMRGGAPYILSFHRMIACTLGGRSKAESLESERLWHPLYDTLWQTKRMPVENIDVPLYVVTSYSSLLHTRGAFETYERAASSKKWFRNHPYQEWYDLYRPEINDELQRFFDFYAKGTPNGWEDNTPPVRISLLGYDGSSESSIIERPYPSYPIDGTSFQKYYLDAGTGVLSKSAPSYEAKVSHEGHHLTASSDFRVFFNKRTELHGIAKVKLWMSCNDHDDMDVVVQIRKISKDGKPLKHLNYPCPVSEPEVGDYNIAKHLGPEGYLRASHHHTLDLEESRDTLAVYRHDSREMIPHGKVVPLEISFWPMGMVIGKGEGILLRVAGHTMALPEAPPAIIAEPDDENVGTHWIHSGGDYDSHLILPVLPKA